MIGFGFMLWLCRFGEIEYGVKVILFGGYILMVGMFLLYCVKILNCVGIDGVFKMDSIGFFNVFV